MACGGEKLRMPFYIYIPKALIIATELIRLVPITTNSMSPHPHIPELISQAVIWQTTEARWFFFNGGAGFPAEPFQPPRPVRAGGGGGSEMADCRLHLKIDYAL